MKGDLTIVVDHRNTKSASIGQVANHISRTIQNVHSILGLFGTEVPAPSIFEDLALKVNSR